jgi:hypothetical protein
MSGSKTVDVYSDDPENPTDIARYEEMVSDAKKENSRDWPLWK